MTDKIDRETLLPCPFCGDDGDKGRQEVTQMIEGRNKFARITCRACGAMCPEENWNQRAAQPVAGRINYGGILDALDGLPNDIKGEFEHLARLVRAECRVCGETDYGYKGGPAYNDCMGCRYKHLASDLSWWDTPKARSAGGAR